MSIANPYLHGNSPEIAKHASLKKRTALTSLAVAAILVGAKLSAFLLTNSLSLLSSLMDSMFDALASLVTLVSISRAALPADADHRFGHGKIEALGALAQALFIAASGIFLFVEALRRFTNPQDIESPLIGIGVMLVSIVLTAGLITFQKNVIRKTGSVAITADHLHYVGDILMNLGVLIALALTYWTGWRYFDPVFSLLISLRLMYDVWQIGRESLDILLDKELSDAEREKIITLVTSHPAVRGVHDLRTRNTGERYFISLHVEMEPQTTIAAVHDVMDELEEMIFNAFPKSEVLIHPEPEGLIDHRLDDQISQSA
jgi:ferrous-iron efflux pump FieF